ncbi:hypothetical protein SKAU_G00296280 [Synaphobranchus kaupii]|uniref:Protein FAM171A2 n=1 Tax=Synaphobranchus kaupii TaxID=118154 RepID=A0A9Q1EUT3_SYNKA|nr:hypothetical protein SKAU_G00296280 [Synaphobranchus kaupii]
MNGYLAGNGDVAITMPPLHISRFLLCFLFFGNVWKVLPKSIPDRGPLEVLIKVQVFDNSDLSPLAHAAIEVHGNQSTLSSGKAGSDGVATVTLQYRPGTWVIITASKQGYVTNSAPWHASRVPLYASVSLYLLPQRPATLILYEDVVQILLGSPGSRNQPWVQFQRKAIGLTLNSTYAEMSAMLTATKSQYEIGGFPYPLGQESANSTGGDGGWVDLTAVGAVSTHLLDRNGTEVRVSEPVYISIPLPGDTPVKSATSVPVWRFEAQKGLWVRNGTGYIKKEGTQMTWSFVASRLGYWLAAFPTASGMALNSTGLRDITAYHTIFLMAILGSMALLVLILLCLLLYYCRRRCLKPRQQHHKLQVSTPLDGSKRDQGTSTSHLNLISGGRTDSATASGDADAAKSELSSRDEFYQNAAARKPRVNVGAYSRRGESFPAKPGHSADTRNQDKRHNNGGGIANDNQGYASDPSSPPPFAGHYQDSRPPEYSASQPADHLTRPTSLNTQPGQLIFCSSMDQMNESMYRSMVPTLVIPAHYMRLSSDLSAVEQALEKQQQQQQDAEGIQMSGELQALTDKKLLELGVKPHPRAWFVSLDGRSNSLVRHSYIELGNERGGGGGIGRPGEGLGPAIGRAEARDSRLPLRKGRAAKAYSKLACANDSEPGGRGRRPGRPLLARGQLPRPAAGRGPGARAGPPSPAGATAGPEDEENDLDDKDDEGENKKSPWQRREERPLMVFNVK